MNSAVNPVDPTAAGPHTAMLSEALQQQRDAYLAHPIPTAAERRQDLKQLKAMLSDNLEAIAAAICEDYGNRSYHETLFAEVIAVTDGINDTIKKVKGWMKPERRHIDVGMYPGAKNRLIPQPLGVVGMIVPWNFPVNLSFSQLAAVFAAGNRAMVKMSENSIALTRLLQQLAPKYFAPEKLQFFEETGGVGIEFSKLPFDLIIFTGSGQTGRAVMAAAAQNLTPVILELGGKAPAVIDPNYDLEKAVGRIMFTKQFNAGQICTNVDYVFVHESQIEGFVQKASDYAAAHCPDINHKDYTSLIDDRSYARVLATIDDAEQKGARVVSLSSQPANSELRKIPLTLILETNAEMTIRQRETFGPLLMVLPYKEPSDVVTYVNRYDRPLALYPFSNNKKLVQYYIDHIMSGGVSVNDCLFHVAQHDLPFGGVGPSGMGHYHGYEGFAACSKMRPVFYQASFTAMTYLRPPYGKLADKVFGMMVKMKS